MLELPPVTSLLDKLPLITDPWFYVVAVPAVLLMGFSKSGFATGFGSLATPMIALTLPAPQAATGLHQLWRERDRALLRRLVPWGVMGVVLSMGRRSLPTCCP